MRGLMKRRRQEAKTDYHARLSMLKSGKVRLVVRKSNRYILAQIVSSEKAQDSVIATVSSKDLLDKGWPAAKAGSLKNRAASYLTGMLVAKIAAKKNISQVILDIGMHRNIKKSRIYAFLKGVIDEGLKVAHDKDSLPSDNEIAASDKDSLVEKLKSKL